MNIGIHAIASIGTWFILHSLTHDPVAATVSASLSGGCLIDIIDHGLYSVIKIRPYTVSNIRRVMLPAYREARQHFYIFHTLEMAILLPLAVRHFRWGEYFIISYLLHLIFDAVRYMKVKRSYSWIKGWSIMIFFWRLYLEARQQVQLEHIRR